MTKYKKILLSIFIFSLCILLTPLFFPTISEFILSASDLIKASYSSMILTSLVSGWMLTFRGLPKKEKK